MFHSPLGLLWIAVANIPNSSRSDQSRVGDLPILQFEMRTKSVIGDGGGKPPNKDSRGFHGGEISGRTSGCPFKSTFR